MAALPKRILKVSSPHGAPSPHELELIRPSLLPFTNRVDRSLNVPTRHNLCLSLRFMTDLSFPSQETERLMTDAPPGISAAPNNDNLRHFDVTVAGPDQSPYEGESRE